MNAKAGDKLSNKFQLLDMIESEKTELFEFWRAHNVVKNEECVVLFIQADVTLSDVEKIVAFERVQATVKSLSHKHFLKVMAYGRHQGSAYIALEKFVGISLEEAFEKNIEFSVEQSVDIIKQISTCLEYLHDAGVIHRTLHPSCIVLDEEGKNNVRLFGFGLLQILDLSVLSTKLEMDKFFGYMSPEVVGVIESPIDERSDLYALGILLYRMLTGKLPYEGEDLEDLLHKQVTVMPVFPVEQQSQIPEDVAGIVMKLLAKSPQARYQSVRSFLFDLERYINGERQFIIAEYKEDIKIDKEIPIVGRDNELKALKLKLQNASDGTGSVSFISGEEGIGKSKFVEAFKSIAQERGSLVLSGQCKEQGHLYHAFRELAEDYLNYLHVERQDRFLPEQKRIKKNYSSNSDVLIKLTPDFSEILGEQSSAADTTKDGEQEHLRFLNVVSDFLLQLGRAGAPCLLVLDGLQEADDGTMALLENLCKEIEESNVMVLASYTKQAQTFSSKTEDFYKKLKQKYSLLDLELKNFDRDQMKEFLAAVLGKTNLVSDEFATFVIDKSKGNPFFAFSVVQVLAEARALFIDTDTWTINWDSLDNFVFPENLLDTILNKVDTLYADEKIILALASVIGKTIGLELLSTVSGQNVADLLKLVNRLVEMNLLEFSAEAKAITFIHEKIRDSIYRGIEFEEREKYHLDVAIAIEKIHSHSVDDVIFELAHHYYCAKDSDSFLKYGLRAATLAHTEYANDESINIYKRVIDLLEAQGQRQNHQWLHAMEGLAAVYLTVGKSDLAIECLENVLPLKESVLEKASLLRKIGRAWFMKGDLGQCEASLVEALSLLGEEMPTNLVKSCCARTRQTLLWKSQKIIKKINNGKTNHASKHRAIVLTYNALAWVYMFTDVRTLEYCALRSLNISEMYLGKNKDYAVAIALYALALTHKQKYSKAFNLFNRALLMRDDVQDEGVYAQCLLLLGKYYLLHGDYQKCIAVLERSKSILLTTGQRWELGLVLNALGYAHFYVGDFANSIDVFTEQHRLCADMADEYGCAIARACLMYVYAHTGEFSKAEEWGKKALVLNSGMRESLVGFIAQVYYGFTEIVRNNIPHALHYLKNAETTMEKKSFDHMVILPLLIYQADSLIDTFSSRVSSLSRAEKSKDLRFISQIVDKISKLENKIPTYSGEILMVSAKYNVLMNRTKIAEKLFERSIKVNKDIGRRFALAVSYYEYGLYLTSVDRELNAREYMGLAHDIFKSTGAEPFLAKCSSALNYDMAADDDSTQQRMKKERRMAALFDTSRFLSSILDPDELMSLILDRVMVLVGAERGVLMLYPDQPGKAQMLDVKVMRNIDYKEFENQDFMKSYMLIKEVERNKKALVVADTAELEPKVDSDNNHWSVLCAPVMARGKMLGVIYLDNRLVSGLFTEDDLWVLDVISSQIGVSIDNARLFTMAAYDGVTGLYNRGFFDNFFTQSFEESRRYEKNLTLVMIDLDLFKQINDQYGHQAGDTVLKKVASTIKSSIRKSDVAARYGGDEFILLLTNTEREPALMVCNRILESVKEHDFVLQGDAGPEIVNVSVSIGAAQLYEGMNQEELMAAADKALYQVKEAGRGAVVGYEPEETTE